MRIFITGASGYVGSVVTEKAVAAGHQVLGLVRSEEGASKVKKLGATPLPGSLEDTDLLANAAKNVDAVLHLGFVHEFNRPYEEILGIDTAAIQAMGKTLTDTNKPLIITSGTGVVKANNGKETTEDSPLRDDHVGERGRVELETLALTKDGIKAMVIRLAPYVYGRGGSYFVPMNIQAAAKNCYAGYVGDGNIMTTTADVDAVADLYLLAMNKGKAGSVFNGTTQYDLKIKDLANAIATALGIASKSITIGEANEILGPFVAQFLYIENRASNAKARKELGWDPKPQYTACEDIIKGSYKPLVESLREQIKVAH